MNKQVQIDVFFPVPEGWGICNACEIMMSQADMVQAPEQRGLEEYPPEYLEEFRRLSALIYTLADNYKEKVHIRIWDPRSLQGMAKSIRHGIRRYPTFVLNGRTKLTGWDDGNLENQVEAAVKTGNSEI